MHLSDLAIVAADAARAIRAQVIDAPRRRWVGYAIIGGVVALVVATALVVVARGAADDSDAPPTQANLALEVLVRHGDDAQTLVQPGEVVRDGDDMQFRVSFDLAGELAIVALDENGNVTLLLQGSRVDAGRGRLLDGVVGIEGSGVERVIALWCPDVFSDFVSNDAIVAAARALIGNVRTFERLALPCEQASVAFDRK
jgi:hypothetical protein